jgi:hypothetical protein
VHQVFDELKAVVVELSALVIMNLHELSQTIEVSRFNDKWPIHHHVLWEDLLEQL